jgi:hypothetical protein
MIYKDTIKNSLPPIPSLASLFAFFSTPLFILFPPLMYTLFILLRLFTIVCCPLHFCIIIFPHPFPYHKKLLFFYPFFCTLIFRLFFYYFTTLLRSPSYLLRLIVFKFFFIFPLSLSSEVRRIILFLAGLKTRFLTLF